MVEMYVSGVSTRKVSEIVEELCGKSVSKSFVSSLTKELDQVVHEWQYCSLQGKKYPYIMVDVMYIKVRENHRVISKSCHIAVGISEEGTREIIGFLIQDGESDRTWSHFFEYLKQRNLKNVKMVISDAHKGLIAAIKKNFTDVSWQRCQVHFLRNIFSSIPKKNSTSFREQVKAIFRLTNIEDARKAKDLILDAYGDNIKYLKACDALDEGFDDAFQYAVNGISHPRLRSTNLLERLNEEVRRREKVIRIFPNVDSATRLIGAILIDKHEKWISSPRAYLKM